jgi:hypothetical protein
MIQGSAFAWLIRLIPRPPRSVVILHPVSLSQINHKKAAAHNVRYQAAAFVIFGVII